MNNDLKNIKNREDRNKRHIERAARDLDAFLKLYEGKIELLSYDFLAPTLERKEFLVLFRLSSAMKPRSFLKLLIDKVGLDV